jgi:hypothetical protein
MTQKYGAGLPLYRQEQQFKGLGIDLSRFGATAQEAIPVNAGEEENKLTLSLKILVCSCGHSV